ncbi:hypothetical protein [Ornithinimicrobium pekingense]|nr:hypothetical protein [Ornithinimicrobium pekingense]
MGTTAVIASQTLRWLGLVGVAVVLGACGTAPPTGPAPDGTPVPGGQPDAADMGPAASGRTARAPEDAAGTAPPSAVPAGEPGLMPGGDGSALALVPTSLELPTAWAPAPPDGPHWRTEVCGVQLDPVEPVDAAQRRWAYLDAGYLESEVHLFPGVHGRDAARAAVEAVASCDGYGVAEDGSEVGQGDGEVDVSVTPVPGAPDGWTVWTETTEQTGMVRHVALAPLETGWHWFSHADLLGRAGPQLLLDVLPATDPQD